MGRERSGMKWKEDRLVVNRGLIILVKKKKIEKKEYSSGRWYYTIIRDVEVIR